MGSRSMAAGVCQRHFTRAGRPGEDALTTITYTFDPDGNGPSKPVMNFHIRNENSNVVIVHADISVAFSIKGGAASMPMTWSPDLFLAAGAETDFRGTFDDQGPPSLVMGAVTVAVQALARTGAPY